MGRWMAAAALLAVLALAAQCGPEAQLKWLAVQLYLNHSGVNVTVSCDRLEEALVPAGGPAPSVRPLGSFPDAAGLAAALREARERALARVGAFVNATARIYMAKAAALLDAGLLNRTAEVRRELEGLAQLLRRLNLSMPLLRPVVDMATCLREVQGISAIPPTQSPEDALDAVKRAMERIRNLWSCFERVKMAVPRLLQERLAALNATRAAIVQAMGLPPGQRAEAVRRAVEEANR